TYVAVTKRRAALTPEQQTDELIAADSKLNYRFGRLSGAILLAMFIGYSWLLFTS
ncbi:MAG: sodium:calcium antiporter, partial [Moritella sp.]|nr:sodium:calcium antiporter [Moritella sp.]